tara:strand:- start:464 stop:1507 length:1044 start_codon:yes stop_codon:yes gene_type:complete
MAKRFEKKTKKKNLPEKVAVKKQDLPDLPDWAKDLFDRKGNLKNYLPSLDEEPKEIPTPPLHPGEVGTSLDIDEHRERGDFDIVRLNDQFDPIYPSQYNQQVNLPYEYERELTLDEQINSYPMIGRMPRDFAEEYVKQNPFSPFRHLNTTDSRKSPFQLNVQRMTEFDDYDDWDEFEQNDDMTGHVFDLPSFLNIPWNEKTAFTRSEPMDLAWRLLKMPIVSDSPEVRQLDVGPAHIHRFQDPVTGEVKPLYISPASNPDSENLYAGIVGNNGDRASAKFNTGGGDYASLDGIETQEPFQRRGYMSAIYDAVEEYLQQHKKGRNLVPSDFQSDEGKAFWESRNKEGM